MRNGTIRNVVLTLMLLAQPVLADGISKWKDANGRVHFGDSPPADVSAEPLTVKPNVYEHPVLEPGPPHPQARSSCTVRSAAVTAARRAPISKPMESPTPITT
ncbi:MAG: DUF4124 domain-containing protein [Gammaproteobacteria bacterium]|nr:DUF4124 domain-containing protein [Gammaproteobacteria bacterium]